MSWTLEEFTGGDKVSSQKLGDLVTGKPAAPGMFESFMKGVYKSGLDTVQGYHLSGPIAAPTLTEWLLSRQHAPDRDLHAFLELRSA
jgi:hypothetical protein